MKRNSVTTEVATAIRTEKRARHDEVALLFEVWSYHGLILTPEQKEIARSLPIPSSILRIARRKLRDS